MVEVFKTNVQHPTHADMLLNQIYQAFPDYIPSFDLEDCDKILRVECASGFIPARRLIELLKDCGFNAEVLPDEPQPII